MAAALTLRIFAFAILLGFGLHHAARAETVQIGAMDGGLQEYLVLPALIKAYQRAGIEMNVQMMPGQRVLAEFKDRSVDGVAGRIRTLPDHIPGIIRSTPALFNIKVKIYLHSDFDFQVLKREDLKNLAIVVPEGSIISDQVGSFARHRTAVRSYSQMLEMLISNRVDAIVAPETAVEIGLAKTGYHDQIHASEAVFAEVPLYHYLDERFATQAALISTELQKMQDSGELQALQDAGWQQMLADAAKGS